MEIKLPSEIVIVSVISKSISPALDLADPAPCAIPARSPLVPARLKLLALTAIPPLLSERTLTIATLSKETSASNSLPSKLGLLLLTKLTIPGAESPPKLTCPPGAVICPLFKLTLPPIKVKS